MKKIFLATVALACSMGMSAQVMRIYNKGTLVHEYSASEADSVVFAEEAPQHAYVEIGGLKWATMNVGATTVAGSPATCYGDYFAWGETVPRYTSITISSDGKATFGGWSSSHSSGYSDTDAPSYAETTLDAAHDAATQNWGADWRTPTNDDFRALATACAGSNYSTQPTAIATSTPVGGIYWLSSTQTYLPEYQGVSGMLFVDKTDTSKHVFFPAAGLCKYKGLYDAVSIGSYFSSTIYSKYAYSLYFYWSSYNPSSAVPRWKGTPIRPVSDK